MTKNFVFLIRKIKRQKTSTRWTEKQNQILSNCIDNLADKSKINWREISSLLKNKDETQCSRRYKTLFSKFKKGRWTEAEDKLLKNLIEKFGDKWCFISKIIGNRSSKQIKSRFEENLNTHIYKNKFSENEDLLIMNLYKIFSNRWTKYLNYLPNRLTKNIKSRYIKIIKNNLYS